jgi:hypothetical protein
MPSTDMLRRVALVRTAVSEERIASIIRVTRISELRNNVSSNLDQSGGTFLRNVGSYMSNTA